MGDIITVVTPRDIGYLIGMGLGVVGGILYLGVLIWDKCSKHPVICKKSWRK